MKTFFFFGDRLKNFCEDLFFFFLESTCALFPWSLALASSIPVLGLESVCPRKGCPWPWPRIFFVSLASSLVSSTPPLTSTIVLKPGLWSHCRNDRANISPELYAKLLNCQAFSSSVGRSFSMLLKLLSNDRHYSPDNIWKYLALYVNKSLEYLNYRIYSFCSPGPYFFQPYSLPGPYSNGRLFKHGRLLFSK